MNLEQYRLIVDSSPNMIWRSDLSTQCDYFNKTWLDFTGRTFNQEVGFGWAQGVHPEDFDRCVRIYTENFAKRSPFEMDYRLRRHDGEYRWINDRGVPFFDRKGQFKGFIGSCMDVTEKIEGQFLKKMAQNDFLCNTFNRQYGMQLLGEIFRQSPSTHRGMSILMIDIDSFKAINDRFGHAAGDLVIQKVASFLQDQIREADLLARYGGDEFIIGLPNTDLDQAMALADRIRSAIQEKTIVIGEVPPFAVTVSIGVKTQNREATLDDLIHAADVNLYRAKNEGKNIVKG